MKLLKDFPLDTWIETADNPADGPCEVKIVWVDQTGTYGTALIKNTSSDKVETLDIGWELSNKEDIFKGKLFRPIIAHATVTLCLNCETLIVNPKIFSANDGVGELHFCDGCDKGMDLVLEIRRQP